MFRKHLLSDEMRLQRETRISLSPLKFTKINDTIDVGKCHKTYVFECFSYAKSNKFLCPISCDHAQKHNGFILRVCLRGAIMVMVW